MSVRSLQDTHGSICAGRGLSSSGWGNARAIAIALQEPFGREVKEQAEAVLAEIGLPIPGLIRTLLRPVAAEGTVLFEPKCPNAETIATMKDLESGNLKSYATVRELMDVLKADD